MANHDSNWNNETARPSKLNVVSLFSVASEANLPTSGYEQHAKCMAEDTGAIYINDGNTTTCSWTKKSAGSSKPYFTLSTIIGDYSQPASAIANSEDFGTLTFSDDGTSYADQTAYDAAWPTSNTSNIRGSPSNDRLEILSGGNTDTICYNDRTSVNDTKWLLRFKFVVSTQTTTTNGAFSAAHVLFGSTTGSYSTTEDNLGIRYRWDNGVTVGFYSFINNGGTTAVGSLITSGGVGTYYIEIVRLDANNLRIRIFSDSNYTVLLGSTTTTISSAYSTLRYLKIHNQNSTGSNGSMTGYVDDISFYDNYTTTYLASNSVDNNTSTYWKSKSVANPFVILDLTSSREIMAMALNLNTTDTTITAIKVRFRDSDTGWSDSDNVMYINKSDFTNNTWRYLANNWLTSNKRYVQIIGVETGVLSIYEVKVRYGVSDITKLLGIRIKDRSTTSADSFVDSN